MIKYSSAIGLLVLPLSGCGGGPGLSLSSPAKNGTSATAYAAQSGTVTAYRLDSNGQRGVQVGTAQTDANGSFELKLTLPSTGPLLISVSSGSYVEPATGTAVNLNGYEITAITPSQLRSADEMISGVLVSPVSHLTAQLTVRYVRANNMTVDAALTQASSLMNSHFGGIDWQALGKVPDLTNPKAVVVQVNAETKAALILAGLSMEARTLAVARGLTAGGALNSLTLLAGLADDIGSDGYFDGANAQGTIQVPSGAGNAYTMDGQTVRGTLATAIRAFLASDRNASQITSADADPTALALAADANLQIFRDGGVGPTLTSTISFLGADGNDHSPVSYAGQQLVSGRLDFTVTASAPAGVASLSIAQGSTPLTPGTGSTLPTKFIGSFDTTKVADGLLTFTAAAKDTAGNISTTRWQFVVDNTAPVIAVTQPVAGAFYSVMIPAAASASDSNAVASIVENSVNIANLKASPDFSGSWTISNSQADGQVMVQYKACDIVFNCRTTPVNVLVDRTPPVIAVTSPPLRYTNNPSQTVSMTMTATDGTGSGVAAVYAKNMTAGAAPVAGVQSSGTSTWTFASIALVANSDNVIVVYGVDRTLGADGLAPTGNSGYGKLPPYQQTVYSTFDNTPPAPVWTRFASYYDESNLQLVLTGADPNNASSWSYNPSASYNPISATKAAVDLNNTVVMHKTTTRLSWFGAPPSVGDLVGANTTNTPLIPYTIPNKPAPVASVTFSATVTCAGCLTLAAATGDLIRDTTYTAGIRYLLPVTSDAIPALAQVTSQATVSITIIATDTAGNVGQITPPQQFQFQLVPPPVGFLEDANYMNGGDPRSAFAFRLAKNTYTGMFNNSTFPNDAARFVRYVAYNPSGKHLAFSPQLGGVPGDAVHAAPVIERWEAWSDDASGQVTAGNCYQTSGVCANDLYSHSPCGRGRATTYLASGGTSCDYFPTGIKPETKQDTWQISALPYQVGGTSEQPAPAASNGGVMVAPASGGIAGRVAIYLSVPSRTVPSILTWNSAFGRYQYRYASYDSGGATTSSCACDRSTPGGCPAGYACWAFWQPWDLYLSQADSQVYGSFTFATSNMAPGTTTAVLGPPSASSAPIIFSRVIGH